MKKFFVILSISLVITLALILVVAVYAQGADTGEAVGVAGEVEGAGIADPPGAGQTVLYMFVGAADSQYNANNWIATSIHCANYGSTDAIIEVQIIDKDGIGPVMTGTETIPPDEIATFSTQTTDVYNENEGWGGVLVNPTTDDDIDQGSGRILADSSGSTSVICTAQVLDPIGQPGFMTKLTLYDGSGNLVGGVPKVYLPLILKNS